MNKRTPMTCRETAQLMQPMPLSLHTIGLQHIFPQKTDMFSIPFLKSRYNESEGESQVQSFQKVRKKQWWRPITRRSRTPCIRWYFVCKSLENQKCLNTEGGIFVSFSGDDAAVTPQYMGDCHAYCQRYYFPPRARAVKCRIGKAVPQTAFPLRSEERRVGKE